MKLRFLCLSMIIFLLFGAFSALGMVCEIPPFVDTAVTPNVLIIYDTTGSMLTQTASSLPSPEGVTQVWFPDETETAFY